MTFTENQERAVAFDGRYADTCIVAGPGSGKTTVLIERYRRLVAAGVAPSRILAITFTEKATAQMKRKLAKEFAGDDAVRREIERAPVSTVHGFCAGLLREHAIAAGIDPEFTVMDEQQAAAVERESASAALDAFFARDPARVRALLGAIETADVRKALLEVRGAMRAAGVGVEALRAVEAEGGAFDQIRAVVGELRVQRTFDWTEKQRTAFAELIDWVGELERLPAQVGREHFRVLGAFKTRKNSAKIRTRAREVVTVIQDVLIDRARAELAAAWYRRERETLIDALEAIDAEHRRRKRALAALDFSDLEERTVELLRSDAGVREAVLGSFDQILMDELQDTNGLQAALIELIRAPGRFYAVGDVNQSIYGFRHADPGVFEAYRGRAERVVELRENFRSRVGILRAVEAIADGAAGIEPHRLHAAREFADEARTAVAEGSSDRWAALDSNARDGARELARGRPAAVEVIACGEEELEPRWVARRVREIQEETGGRFSDIALLFRASRPMAEFARALEAEGIPYSISAAKGFFECREVADLVHVLRVLANPLDEVSFAAVARSPLVGAGDADLARWKLEGQPVAAMEPVLDLRDLIDVQPLEQLLRRAMDESGYEAALPPRGRMNVEKLLDLVRSLSRRMTLDRMVEELDLLRESDPREADAQPDELGDKVRLQTIHSAKGLEFPVVFLVTASRRAREDSPEIAFDPAAGLGVKWRDPAGGAGISDPMHERVKTILGEARARESDRLLYVGLTRAESRLVITWSGKVKEWAVEVNSRLAIDGVSGVQTSTSPAGESFAVRKFFVSGPPEPREPLAAGMESMRPRMVERPASGGQYPSTATVTEVAEFAACPRRYYLSRVLGIEPRGDGGTGAMELGSLVHQFLAGEEVASAEARELGRRFEESELGLRASATLLAEREYEVEFAVEDIVLRGAIDLWFEDRGETVVVDYKTASAMREEYAAQVRLYALAMNAGRGFVSLLRSGETIEVDVSRAGSIDVVRRFRAAHERGEFPLREGERCLRCPHFGGACPAGAEVNDSDTGFMTVKRLLGIVK